eukprot:TRINITY_DN12915_c0_g1_i2.p1 TRINITY_DN12915_c0_g1~~TRINITY_DN12915_c0_g1_i2.p1  ORF type:complete len:117 (+),score=10.98 TRINITY_DN12915_c0_g1_i2:74-424(+)
MSVEANLDADFTPFMDHVALPLFLVLVSPIVMIVFGMLSSLFIAKPKAEGHLQAACASDAQTPVKPDFETGLRKEAPPSTTIEGREPEIDGAADILQVENGSCLRDRASSCSAACS